MDIYSETLIKKKLTAKEKKLVKMLFALILISSFVFILQIPKLLVDQLRCSVPSAIP